MNTKIGASETIPNIYSCFITLGLFLPLAYCIASFLPEYIPNNEMSILTELKCVTCLVALPSELQRISE